jgi:dihydrofolate reductase
MRTVTYGAACSLDGFITARDGAIDWLHFSPEVGQVMGQYWSTVDTVLFGRRTWEVARAQAASSAPPARGGPDAYVFSRTLRPDDVSGATLVTDDPGEFVRALKAREGRGICVMGGSELARSLFEAGVIDEVGLNIHPVLLGSGTPLFRDPGIRVHLELVDSRVIAGGCILANYRVRRA